MTPDQRSERTPHAGASQASLSPGAGLPPAVRAELRSVAHGNPGREERLRSALTRLAAGAGGPDLREMAAEVLAGRVTLRGAVLSGAYCEALRPAVEQLMQWTDARVGGQPERPGPVPATPAPARQSPGHCLPAAGPGPAAVTGADPPASGLLASRLAAARASYACRGTAESARRRER